MNGNQEMMNLTGAYVLHALTPEEEQEFELFLETSEQARQEVAELTDTATILAYAADPVQPSVQVKNDLFAQISRTPQVQAETKVQAMQPVVSPEENKPVTLKPAEQKARNRWFNRQTITLSAMAASVAIIAGGVATTGVVGNMQTHQVQESALVSLMQAPDSHKTQTQLTTGGTATVLWSAQDKTAAVMLHEAPALSKDKAYQLWYIGADGTARAAGLLPEGSSTWKMLSGDMKTKDSIGLTVEPNTGSQQPTTKPVMVVDTQRV
jgi:anti-sigma-K factor RskA